MARDESAVDRIYRLVRDDLVAGILKPDAHVDAVRLAARHRASPTPVREALSRLHGEGFLAVTPRRGYFAPRLTRGVLEDLYDWSALLARAAVAETGDVETGAPAAEYGARVRELTVMLTARLSNAHARTAFVAAQRRLELVRASEAVVIEDAAGELERLIALVRARDSDAQDALAHFHARRREQARALVGHVLERLANGVKS